jgi:hypothetical protein
MLTTAMNPGSLPLRLMRALPDGMTACVFFWVWMDPSGWRRQLVAQGILILLLEFILIHSGAFLGSALFEPGMARSKRLQVLLGMGAFYSLFVAVWSWQFQSAWPLLFFGWLLGAKLLTVLLNHRQPETARWRQQGLLGASALYFLLCVPGALFLPLPRLGLTHHGHYYGVPGSGEWVSQPHTAIAAAVLYFGLLALTKLLAWDLAFARNARRQHAQAGEHSAD